MKYNNLCALMLARYIIILSSVHWKQTNNKQALIEHYKSLGPIIAMSNFQPLGAFTYSKWFIIISCLVFKKSIIPKIVIVVSWNLQYLFQEFSLNFGFGYVYHACCFNDLTLQGFIQYLLQTPTYTVLASNAHP